MRWGESNSIPNPSPPYIRTKFPIYGSQSYLLQVRVVCLITMIGYIQYIIFKSNIPEFTIVNTYINKIKQYIIIIQILIICSFTTLSANQIQ